MRYRELLTRNVMNFKGLFLWNFDLGSIQVLDKLAPKHMLKFSLSFFFFPQAIFAFPITINPSIRADYFSTRSLLIIKQSGKEETFILTSF